MSQDVTVSLHRGLIVRLAVVGGAIALIAGILGLWGERSRAADQVTANAVEDTRGLAALIAPQLGPEGGVDAGAVQQALEAYAASRTPRSTGRFTAVRLYDPSGAVIAALSREPSGVASLRALEGAAWPHAASAARSEALRIDGRPHVHVLVPLLSPAGDVIGAAEGVFRFSDAAVAGIRMAGVRALLLVLAVVLATTGVLYPVIARLTRRVVVLSQELLEANLETVGTLGSAIAKRDSDTDAHNFRVAIYALRLGEKAGLGNRALRTLAKGALLHDVGKIGIRDAVLLKPGKLDEAEFQVMKTHVVHGVDIVDRARWLHDAKQVVHGHQEKFDGSGYPRGLRGAEIPATARIFAIADVFDALSSKRPYKDPFPLEKVLATLREGSGTHFDPALLELFLAMAPELHGEYANHDDQKLRDDLRSTMRRYFSGDLGEMAADDLDGAP